MLLPTFFLGFLDGPCFDSVRNCFSYICEANPTLSHIFKWQTYVRWVSLWGLSYANKQMYDNCKYICQFRPMHFAEGERICIMVLPYWGENFLRAEADCSFDISHLIWHQGQSGCCTVNAIVNRHYEPFWIITFKIERIFPL